MRLGLSVSFSGSRATLPMELIQEAERLAFHSAWTAEAYGSDAVTTATWIAAHTKRLRVGTAILQMPARTPTMTAMTATTLDQLSGGRFLLGLGPSGPQVAEGWHGIAYGKPLADTREYLSIVRNVWARERPLEYRGERYQIPYRGPDATGLGKSLKSILHGRQIPIYLASLGPKSVEQAAEIADGWLPFFFSPRRLAVYRDALEAGFAKAGGGKGLDRFDVAPPVTVIEGDDVNACLDRLKPVFALYVGGMGARGKNFYNDVACRYGFADAARKIQDLYLDGKKNEAIAAVPDALVDEVSLCGPKERIRDRLAEWKESPITTMILSVQRVEAMRIVAEAVS